MVNKSLAWIIYLGCLHKKSCQLPGNSHDVRETLPSNLNFPRNFSHIGTRGPILLLCPCLRRQSKRGKYPYSPRGHAMKSDNTFDLLGNLDNIIVSWIVMFRYVYIQCFYVLMKFSISVLYHCHQQSIYKYTVYVYLLRPYDLPLLVQDCWSKKAGCIKLQHLRSYRLDSKSPSLGWRWAVAFPRRSRAGWLSCWSVESQGANLGKNRWTLLKPVLFAKSVPSWGCSYPIFATIKT